MTEVEKKFERLKSVLGERRFSGHTLKDILKFLAYVIFSPSSLFLFLFFSFSLSLSLSLSLSFFFPHLNVIIK